MIGGSFKHNVTFGGTRLETSANDFVSAIPDAFVAKLGADGTLVWAVPPGMNLGGEIDRVAIDPLGNVAGAGRVFPTGVFVGKLDKDGLPLAAIPVKADLSSINNGVTSLTSDALGNTILAGFDDAGGFLYKYDAQGTLVWQKDPITDQGRADVGSVVALDAQGTLLVAGNADAGSVIAGHAVAAHSLFFAQYDSAGTLGSLQLTGSPAGGAFYELRVTPAGDRFVTGDSLGAWTTGAGQPIVEGRFVAGCDAAGQVQWVKVPVLDDLNDPQDGALRPLALDAQGNLTIAGRYQTQATFDAITLR